MSAHVTTGDALEQLALLPAGSVDCIVTSPPYYQLRDYGIGGQIGLEPSLAEYVDRLVAVFRECRRVLAPHGTCWLNLGDSYNAKAGGAQGQSGQRADRTFTATGLGSQPDGTKPKDLLGVPWRVALALQADGWWLRSDIIWAKPNCMPSSVRDRPSSSYEHVFLLTKQPRYYYDQEALREPHSPDGRRVTKVVGGDGSLQHRDGERWPNGGRNGRDVWTIATEAYPLAHFATYPTELARRCVVAGCPREVCETCGVARTRISTYGPDPSRPQAKRAMEIAEANGLTDSHIDALRACGVSDVGKALVTTNGTGRNADDVQALADEARAVLKGYAREFLIRGATETLGWSDCGHGNYRPGIVLDPFTGSGTTGVAALREHRHFTGIELNPEYAQMARARLRDWHKRPARPRPTPDAQGSLL